MENFSFKEKIILVFVFILVRFKKYNLVRHDKLKSKLTSLDEEIEGDKLIYTDAEEVIRGLLEQKHDLSIRLENEILLLNLKKIFSDIEISSFLKLFKVMKDPVKFSLLEDKFRELCDASDEDAYRLL